MAAGAYSSKYNTASKDRGLQAIFDEAALSRDLQKELTSESGIYRWTTSEHLFYSLGMTQESVADNIEALLANYPRFTKAQRGEAPNHEHTRAKAKLTQCWAIAKRRSNLPQTQK